MKKFQNIIALFIVCVFTISSSSLVFANDGVYDTNKYVQSNSSITNSNDNWEYILENGEVTITLNLTGTVDVVVPSEIDGYPVTALGDNVFINDTWIESIIIPESVKSIGNSAFMSCTNLESIVLPEIMDYIGNDAFTYCSRLTNVELPDGIEELKSWFFMGCWRLESVNIPSTVKKIGTYAFDGCTALKDIYIEDLKAWSEINYTEKQAHPFMYADNLWLNGKLVEGTVNIPAGTTRIGDYAFFALDGIKEITIPNGVKTIGEYAFSGCSGISSIVIPEGVTSIGEYAFVNCWNLTSITIPDTVTSIGKYAIPSTVKVHRLECKHTYGSYKTTKKAGFRTKGTQTSTCQNDNCTSKKTKSIPALKTPTLSTKTYTFNNKVKKPSVTVKNTAGSKISKSVSYAKGRKAVGKYAVKVTVNTANYKGTKTVYFKINPAKPASVKLTKGKKQFKVSWKKPSATYRKQITGYQVRYATSSSKLSKAKPVTVKGSSVTSKTIKSLKAKKKYYVQVRTYKTVKGVKYYSDWSAKKYITTK